MACLCSIRYTIALLNVTKMVCQLWLLFCGLNAIKQRDTIYYVFRSMYAQYLVILLFIKLWLCIYTYSLYGVYFMVSSVDAVLVFCSYNFRNSSYLSESNLNTYIICLWLEVSNSIPNTNINTSHLLYWCMK